jgi:transcriptional antiterminator RfaH
MGWSVIQTYGACERKAVKNLEQQGFDAFCPFYTRPIFQIAQKGPRELPLFPCYAFVRIDPDSVWAPVNSTPGIIRLLTNRSKDNPQPLFVTDDYVASLTNLIKSSENDRLPANTVIRVKQRNSPFYDMQGLVVGMDKDDRLKVLMLMFNRRDVVVEFLVSSIEVMRLPDQ